MNFHKNRIFEGLLIANIAVIPISSFLSSRLLFITFVFSIVTRSFSIAILLRRSWDLLLYILCISIGLVYTVNIKSGLSILETSFGLLAIPFILSGYNTIDTVFLKKQFMAFALGLSLICLLFIGHASILYIQNHNPDYFYYYNFTGLFNYHPTYLAYYLIYIISVILFYSFEMKKLVPWYVYVSVACYLILLLFTGGYTAYVSLLLVFAFFMLKLILNYNDSSGIPLLIFALILFIAIFMWRGGDNNSDSWDRSMLWTAALDANSNFLFGVGSGDVKDVLTQYYVNHGLTDYAKDSLNTHNQFLEQLLSNGIIGVTCLLFILGRPLYYSFIHNDSLGILVYFPFIIYGVSEVYLGRYQGVSFVALLHQLIVGYYQTNMPLIKTKDLH